MRVNENIDVFEALELAEDTFFCGKSSGGCFTCHPSCASCAADGTCESCNDLTATPASQNYVCLCPAGTGGMYYNQYCRACDSSCATCFLATKDSCKTCAGGTTPTVLLVGACDCTSPGVVKAVTNPSNIPVACTHCASGCDDCFGSDPSKCLAADQVAFMNYVSTNFNLPLLTETDDNFRCYLQPRPEWDASGCEDEPIMGLLGPVINYDSGATAFFTKSECKKLLTVEWLTTIYWFDNIFYPFSPSGASDSEKSDIKSIIMLWMLQFGTSEFMYSEWAPLRTAFTTLDWTKFLAWMGSTPGYLTDGTSASKKPFPTALLNWLTSARGCHGVTAGCVDLRVFNLKSTVCSNPSCTVKSLCQEVDVNSNCVTSGTGTDV